MRFTVRAPASSANLGPGFDALGLAVDLWNEVEIDTEGEPGAVTYEGRDVELFGETDRENLSLRAMRQLAEAHGRTLPGFSLTARTQVPVARGLGSSAAALVSGLLAADHLLGLGLSQDEIFSHAWRMEGHGDNVGAALYGGAILAVPKVIRAIRLCDGEGLKRLGLTAVYFIPEITGATWAARAALPAQIPYPDAVHNIATASGLAVGLQLGDHELIAAGMDDRLHEPYRARLFPHLTPLTDAARAAGAVGACLSGAGPSILALVEPGEAPKIAAAFESVAPSAGVQGEAVVLAPSAIGAHVVADHGVVEASPNGHATRAAIITTPTPAK